MKIYMMTDLEGVAGVVSFDDQTYPTGKHYEAARKLLTAEVNAAVQGCLDAGATEVLVIDGHGPGGIWFEDLHPEARLYHGRPVPGARVFIDLARGYDAGMLIGQHAMAGLANANLHHTFSSQEIEHMKLNGQPIGEIAAFALGLGACGLPMIYMTGDDEACREVQALIPGIVTVAVKQTISRNTAISLAAVKSRALIRAGATRAIRQHQAQPVKPLAWKGPFELVTRYFHTDRADGMMTRRGFERVDGQTVRRRGQDIIEVLYG